MMKIGASNGLAGAQEPRPDSEARMSFDDARYSAGDRARSGGPDVRPDRDDGRFKDSGDEREALFLKRLGSALGKLDRHEGPDRDVSEMRLLAFAGDPALLQVFGVVAPIPPAGAEPAPAAEIAPRIDDLAKRIEAAVNVSLRSGIDTTQALKLDLLDGSNGISGIAVKMGPNVLEITLVRSIAELPSAAPLAAQALADRLRVLFPRRIVTVFEANTSSGQKDDDGMNTISRLLSRREDRS